MFLASKSGDFAERGGYTEDVPQIEAVKEFMKALKIKFAVTKQEDHSNFIAEMQNILNQGQQIKASKLLKQSAKEFLNEFKLIFRL